jgi:hypothetical protein
MLLLPLKKFNPSFNKGSRGKSPAIVIVPNALAGVIQPYGAPFHSSLIGFHGFRSDNTAASNSRLPVNCESEGHRRFHTSRRRSGVFNFFSLEVDLQQVSVDSQQETTKIQMVWANHSYC